MQDGIQQLTPCIIIMNISFIIFVHTEPGGKQRATVAGFAKQIVVLCPYLSFRAGTLYIDNRHTHVPIGLPPKNGCRKILRQPFSAAPGQLLILFLCSLTDIRLQKPVIAQPTRIIPGSPQGLDHRLQLRVRIIRKIQGQCFQNSRLLR